MSKQNIFDDQMFFQSYLELRASPDSANCLEEKPALFSMLGDVAGKSILDLGCGYGENCICFSKMGAKNIVGVDISRKMLEISCAEHAAPNVVYHHMPMEDIDQLNETFDIVLSSLALHYVEDFSGLARNIAALLNIGGFFLFSQEHPLTTAPRDGVEWGESSTGEITHYCLRDYGTAGKRNISWFVDGIEKYHRTFSDLVNGLVEAGFSIEEMREPLPSPKIMERLPQRAKSIHKPNFLLIKAMKNEHQNTSFQK